MNKKYYLLLIPVFFLFASTAHAFPAGTTHDSSQSQCLGTNLGVTSVYADSEISDVNALGALESDMNSAFSGDTSNWTTGTPPTDFSVNPQNYCISGRVTHTGSPTGSAYSDTYKLYLDVGSGLSPQSNVTGPPSTLYAAATYTVSPPAVTLTANPATNVSYGGSSNLSWNSTNTSSCTSSQFTTGGATSGSVSTGPLMANTPYTITCAGTYGGSAQSQVTVYVNPPPTPTATLTTQNGTHSITIVQGSSTTFNYTCNGAKTATVLPTVGSVTVQSGTTGSVSPGVGTTPYTLACTNPASSPTSASDTVNVTVTAALPDLIATVGPVITVTAGQSFTPTATITNQGNGPTSGSFQNLLTICDLNCTGYHDQYARQGLGATLAAGSNENVSASASYTLSTPGTYYYQWTANMGTSGLPSVSESNSGNNTSAWQTITVNPVPIANLSANTPSAISGSAGSSYSFSGVITNTGNAASSGSFQNILQVCDSGVIQSGSCSSYNTVSNAGIISSSIPATTGTAPISYTQALPATSGNYAYRWCANEHSVGTNSFTTDNGTIETITSDNCGGWTTLTVGPALPTLTPIGLSPLTPMAGVAVTFTGTIQNSGSVPSGPFYSKLYLCPSSDSACIAAGSAAAASAETLRPFSPIYDRLFALLHIPHADAGSLNTVPMSQLNVPSNSTGTNTGTFTFPTSSGAAWQYILCADYPYDIAVANKSTLCNSWTTFTVTIPPTVTCSPNPNTVVPGATVTWSPVSTNFSPAPTYTWNDGGGVNGSGSGSTFTDTYASPGTYQTTVTASNGTQTAGPTVCLPQVTVSAPTVTLSAQPDRVQPGTKNTLLTWTSSGLTDPSNSCTLSGNGLLVSGQPTSNAGGYTDPNPITAQTKYTISCTTGTSASPGTAVKSTAIVNIVPIFTNF